jgi:hypothetical protein
MPLYMMPLKYRHWRCEAHDKIYRLLILFLLVELLEGLHLFSCTILQNSTTYCLSLFTVLKIVIYSEICCFQYFVLYCRSLRGAFVWFPGYHVHEIFNLSYSLYSESAKLYVSSDASTYDWDYIMCKLMRPIVHPYLHIQKSEMLHSYTNKFCKLYGLQCTMMLPSVLLAEL